MRLFFIFLFLPLASTAQNSVEQQALNTMDSLDRVILKAKNDTSKVRAYLQQHDVIRLQSPKSGFLRSQKADSICAANLRKKLSKKERTWYLRNRSASLKALGNYYMRTGRPEKSMPYYRKSLKIAHEMNNDADKAFSTINIANVYYMKGDFANAIDMYTEGLRLSEKVNNDQGISNALINIGAIYMAQENYEKAYSYIVRAYKIKKRTKDRQLGRLALFTADALTSLERYDEAYKWVKIGLEESRKVGDTRSVILGITSFGDIAFAKEEFDEALSHYEDAFERSVVFDDIMEIAKSAANLSRIHYKLGDYNASVKFADKSLELALENKIMPQVVKAYRWKYQSLEKLGRLADAYTVYKNFIAVRDTMDSQENQQEIIRQEFKYDYGKKAVADSVKYAKDKQIQKQILKRKEVTAQRTQIIVYFLIGLLVLAVVFVFVFRKQKRQIGNAKDRSDELLHNILPSEVAEELKEKGQTKAQSFETVSVLFTDFKGFTQTASSLSASELVLEINTCFTAFDHIAEKYGIEKIKTIGDAYMAAGGLPIPDSNAAKNTVLAAIEMQEYIVKRKAAEDDNLHFDMRVGIHSGPVVAGVVGVKKFQYDIWGDTVNTASRVETNCEIGKVNIGDSTYLLIKDDPMFSFEKRSSIDVKGKGQMSMWFVSLRQEMYP